MLGPGLELGTLKGNHLLSCTPHISVQGGRGEMLIRLKQNSAGWWIRALRRCSEHSSPSRCNCAQATCDPSCLAWDPGCWDSCWSCIHSWPCPCRSGTDWPGILAWPQPCLIPLTCLANHCPAGRAWLWPLAQLCASCSRSTRSLPCLFCCNKGGGKENHRKWLSCQSTSLILKEYSEQLQSLTNLMDQPSCFRLSQYQAPKQKGWRNRSSGSVHKGQ